jgi:DNA polymerase-3 subunit gamma/tau
VSYTVLAVKWRPRRFEHLVGQSHVVQALVNSLAAERLHHAYLFAGTRGVGKTTVARILAKALNCERGIMSEPCGECEACIAIDEGRFVDLIEVDAASRTKVDDTRELLDNVQYMPSRGRFKVYLIDEVHMLSNHSFNALLKTLEEPPPHVKFLLATTDPQKLPITVLSRCLQFNLKKLTPPQILGQLEKICGQEGVTAEEDALQAVARAADGSMRDALSLLDQAIAFGGGSIKHAEIAAMLGTIDRAHVLRLVEFLSREDGAGLLVEIAQLDESAPSYASVLDELMSVLQRIAVIQLIKESPSEEDPESLLDLAARLLPEDVQLYYQIALNGRRDLAWCRDERMGFEMTMLRMLAFRPREENPATPSSPRSSARTDTPRSTSAAAAPKSGSSAAQAPAPPARSLAAERPVNGRGNEPGGERGSASEPASPQPAAAAAPASERTAAADDEAFADWEGVVQAAGLRGAARRLADHCEVGSVQGKRLELVLAHDKVDFNTEQVRMRIQNMLAEHLGRELQITIVPGEPPRPTPAERRIAGENERMRVARKTIEADPNIKAVQSAFDAVLEADSIHPTDK